MQHSSQQQPSASLRAGTAHRAAFQSVVTPPSTPNILPHYDREMLRPIHALRRFDAKLSGSTANVGNWKVIVGISEVVHGETLTLGDTIFDLRPLGAGVKTTSLVMRGLPVQVRSRAPDLM
jgi:hypothetical protein